MSEARRADRRRLTPKDVGRVLSGLTYAIDRMLIAGVRLIGFEAMDEVWKEQHAHEFLSDRANWEFFRIATAHRGKTLIHQCKALGLQTDWVERLVGAMDREPPSVPTQAETAKIREELAELTATVEAKLKAVKAAKG